MQNVLPWNNPQIYHSYIA